MAVFTATFNAVAITAAQDLFEIVASSTRRIVIHEMAIGQYTDFGDAAAEILSVLIMRGHTTTGSGGSAVTPANVRSNSGAESCTATVAKNNTTVATGGSPETLRAEAWNVQAPYIHSPGADERIELDAGERLVFRITAPADSITTNATVTFEEFPIP